MDGETRRLLAAAELIERIRRVGMAGPIRGPERRALEEIAAAGAQVVVLGSAGVLEIRPGGATMIEPAGPGWMDDVDVADDVDAADRKSEI